MDRVRSQFGGSGGGPSPGVRAMGTEPRPSAMASSGDVTVT